MQRMWPRRRDTLGIVQLCKDHMGAPTPLALRVQVQRAGTRPGFPAIIARLGDGGRMPRGPLLPLVPRGMGMPGAGGGEGGAAGSS